MMLTKIEVEDLQGNTLSLPLQDSSSGYTVKNIDGLDPVKSLIVFSQFAQLDGSQFQGARRENRNIVLTIGIEPYFGVISVRELRQILYSYFMPKTTVNINFFTDGVLTSIIQGQVESCETPLFSKEPELVISILCFDPNFSSPASVVVAGHTVSNSTEQTITYPGSVETGYLLTVNVNRAATGFTIYNRRPNGNIATLDFGMALLTGDIVKISTMMRNKYATLTRAGVTTSVIYAISTVAKWSPLYPGDNFYRVLATGANIPFTLEYTAKYGGL